MPRWRTRSPARRSRFSGTVKFEADTSVAMDKRLVSFARLKVSEMNFATASREQTQDIATELQTSVNSKPERIIALDRVLANIDKSAIIPKNVEGVKADAPKIFYSSAKAILLGFDGDPIWSPIKENDLKYVINTNWDVFQDGPSKTLYLRDGKYWYTAMAIDGPWSPAGKLPESFKKLPADENWKEVKANYPGDKIDAKKMPKVFVSTAPAEMILIDGAPNYLLVEGTKDLLWIENTESDVFRVQKDGPIYYLVSGRWFSAPDFNGPWTFATPSLPPQFKQIPPEHPRSRVLASVPGTDQANEAVLLAQVPQTARVNRKQLKAPDVQYEGDPKFEAIPQTQVARATNTDKDIIKFGDVYYMCADGVWFTAKAATGPWEVASSIPKEIYRDPAELALAQRDLRHRRRGQERRRLGDVRRSSRLHGDDGRVGVRGVGHGLVLPPIRRLRRLLSCLLSLLPVVWRVGLVQPRHGRIWPPCVGLRPLWRRHRRGTLQPAHGHVFARRGGVRAVRRARRRLRV